MTRYKGRIGARSRHWFIGRGIGHRTAGVGVLLAAIGIAGTSAAITNANEVLYEGASAEFIWVGAQTNGKSTLCTAVLVTPARMLTAAHCVNGVQNWPLNPASTALDKNSPIHFSRGDGIAEEEVWNNPVVSFTPGAYGFPYRYAAWDTRSPMPFDNPDAATRDLAIVPLDHRISSYIATPAVMPFDPDGTLHSCSSSFSGRFLGFGSSVLIPPSSPTHYLTEATNTTFPSFTFFGAYPSPYAEGWSRTIDLVSPVDAFDVFDLLQGSTPHFLQHGDSGGPLYEGDKLCGINSETWPFDPECSFSLLPAPHFTCDIYAENWHARVDTEEARDFLLPLLVDTKGNWVGTCGDVGPQTLQDLDTDHDLIPDACDPCPTVKDERYLRTGQYTDYPDSDGDFIPDVCDACPDLADTGRQMIGGRWVQPDSDGDGIGDACDTCPRSDVREAADTDPANNWPFQSDWVCCAGPDGKADDSLCGNPTHDPGGSLCVAFDPSVTLSSHPDEGFAPTDCKDGKGIAHYFRCSRGYDADLDGTSDQCDNCPGLFASQQDSDADGVGDACDNCPGQGEFPGDHAADQNGVASMYCTTDAQCKVINPESVCVPGPVRYYVDTGLTVAHPRCSKFKDDEGGVGDGVGDACDNCPDTLNHEVDASPGDLNKQPNCNLLTELVKNVPYPYVGDACDPNPCNRIGMNGARLSDENYDSSSGTDLWVTESYDPQILPNTYKPRYFPEEGMFASKYAGTPVATVGARTCDCPAKNGKFRNALQCHTDNLCPVASAWYDDPDPTNRWRHMETYKTVSPTIAVTLPPQPDASHFAFNTEVSALPLEAAAGTIPSVLPGSNDHLAPYGKAPRFVSWDLTASQATDFGSGGYGLVGVYWTAVRNVPQVPVASVSTYTTWSNRYSSGFLGKAPTRPGQTKAACPLCSIDDCEYCLRRICRSCMPSADMKSLVTSPQTGEVFAQSSIGAVDITGEFSEGALEAVLQPDTRWVIAAERGSWIGENGLAFATLSTDGTTVESALVASSEGVTLLGDLTPLPRPDAASLAPQLASGPAVGPAPRSDFGAVLSGHEKAIFLIGGQLGGGSLARDLWMYDLEGGGWFQMQFTGPAPRNVLAATYLPDTRSLWIVDESGQHHRRVRLLRYDFDTGRFRRLGTWRHTPVFDRIELSGAPGGNLLLSGSSTLTDHVAGVVLRPDRDDVDVIGAFREKGTLAVEPTLGDTALTLPLVSSSPTGSDNTVIPLKDVLFTDHGHKRYHKKHHHHGDHDDGRPPHISIGDVL